MSEDTGVWLIVTVDGLEDREVWIGLEVPLTRVEVG